MRFNEREMKVLGTKVVNAEKEGRLLYKRSTSSKGYKYRWFRLRGNLLFYFSMNDTGVTADPEPRGVLVLERCKVRHEPFQDRNHVFSVAFLDDREDRKHYFASPSQSQSEEWVSKLRKASYEQLRATLTIIQAQILKLTGKEPMEAFRQNIITAMKQAGEQVKREGETARREEGERRESEGEPELRDGRKVTREDSRRKGVSATLRIFSDPVTVDVGNIAYLDMPMRPVRKASFDWRP